MTPPKNQPEALDVDRELWVVEVEDWALPVFADHYTFKGVDLLLVQPAVLLAKQQENVLSNVLKVVATGTMADGSNRVWIEKSTLAGIAHKASGITPEFYVRWPGRKLPKANLDEPTIDPKSLITHSQEAFVNYMVKKCPLLDRVQAHLFLQAFRQSGLEYSGFHKKTIDFGWFKIVPLPYRVNWKETLYAIEEAYLNETCGRPGKRIVPRRWISMLKKHRGTREEWFLQQRADCFLDAKLLDVNSDYEIVRWHLNLVESDEWRNYVLRVEQSSIKRRGAAGYAAHVIREISARFSTTLDTLSAWAAQVGSPCGAVVSKRRDGEQRIVPYQKPTRCVPESPAPPVIPVVVDDSPKLTGPEPLQTVAEATPRGLRTVLYLQPNDGDVRKIRGNLDKPEHESGGTEGVPLHDGSESPATGESVLAEGSDGRDDGQLE